MRAACAVILVGVLVVAAGGAADNGTPATTSASAPSGFAPPRIAMFWSPAETRGEPLLNTARHDVIVTALDKIGLDRVPHKWFAMRERIDPKTVPAARRRLFRIRQVNPRAAVLLEVYFFEEDARGYPADHPWWQRGADGNRVQFWPGAYRMDLSNGQYVAHVARRIKAVHDAMGDSVGIFLDNLRFDAVAKAGWLSLLKQVRADCGPNMPVLVNAGWDSNDLAWVAPLVNGIQYEDAVHHADGNDTEAFYARVAEFDTLTRRPRISVNEVYGKRTDIERMRRELIRTLVYTNAAFLYADSTHGHRHRWYDEWGAPLGAARDRPATPRPGRLARRRYANGLLLWLPASASGPQTVEVPQAMTEAITRRRVTSLALSPGRGAILLTTPPASQPTAG
ncbi:MAG TPA: putative glycoside hydrolase [Phycisphaerae bacterium]|nr:putative glycoside hydrolase [Phycisphaerae bacterium]